MIGSAERFANLFQKSALSKIAALIHQYNSEKGFWEDWEAVHQDSPSPEKLRFQQLLLIEKMDLAHGELSEALEALRDGDPQDRHLPQYKAFDVEIADALIRILDLIDVRRVDIAHVVAEKVMYNRNRPHKHGKEL